MTRGKIEKSMLGVHLDVGHDSIGWCVTRTHPGCEEYLAIPGCGVVLFPADDCLANQRRSFRRQRRHIRATRQRIARMRALLLQMGVLTAAELDTNLTSAPWKLAAEVLAHNKKLSWQEMWCVLRWYAHNRGYDGNRLASAKNRSDADDEDIKKNQAARELMSSYGTDTMAETMCRYMKIDPQGKIFASRERFKGLGVSFDRTVVVHEVSRILESHKGALNGLDDRFIQLLMKDPLLTENGVPGGNFLYRQTGLPFKIQNRYWGGILFGQLAPRFDNRIIGHCPVSGKKLPSKSTREFLEFRWAMMLANVRVGEESRQLSVNEMSALNQRAATVGGFTKGDFKKLVASVSGSSVNNLDALMTAPDADKSLVRYPGVFALSRRGLLDVLDEVSARKFANMLFRGKRLTLKKIAEMVGGEMSRKVLSIAEEGKKTRCGKKVATKEIVEAEIRAELPSGRAPYAREVMLAAAKSVYEGKHPMDAGGVLYRDPVMEDAIAEKDIDKETNNHLIRHRVKILLRLMKDIVHDYAENNPAQIGQVTIEMARDLKDLSGMTNKQIVSDMNDRTRQHKNAARLIAKHLGIEERQVSPGLIRKVRIAEDMGWTCPYTGQQYDIQDIVSRSDGEAGVVDKDHILPRSQRAADSLDSLVLTYTEVNRMKGARTGLQFIRECAGQRVEGRNNLVVVTEQKYRSFIEGLKIFGHDDDRKRQKRRKLNLLRLKSDEAGMTEGMLTRTSYITKLAAKALRGYFAGCGRTPEIVSIPGRVTAELRMQWNILGLLSRIDNRILDEKGNLRLKQEIRGITHMHHAVDAITLGLAASLLPRNGEFWATMCKRRVSEVDKENLRAVGCFEFSARNEPRLKPLPKWLIDQIESALSEQRVFFHQPSERAGLKVQQNIWGVEKIEGGYAFVHQRSRDEKTGKLSLKRDKVPLSKAFGATPKDGDGKLKRIKGVLLPDVNFGVALLSSPRFIRHQLVWNELALLKDANGGRLPKIIRRGGLISVPEGKMSGVWRVASVKDNTSGIALDLVRPFAIKPENKVSHAKINVLLSSLINSNVDVVESRYTGVPACPIISSTSQPTESRSR